MNEQNKAKKKILVVDDLEINRQILIALLQDDYEIIEADSGESALLQIDKHFSSISLILLDLLMPGIDGFHVLSALKDRGNMHIPVIIITAFNEREQEKRGLALGAVDFIPKPFDPDIVRYRVEAQIKLKSYSDHLEAMVEEKIQKMSNMWASTMQAMAEIIEYRNQESGLHVKRTSLLTRMILTEMNKNPKLGYFCSLQDLRFIFEAAALHDIGKIGISDNVLLKPGALSNEEFDTMKTHTSLGLEMCQRIVDSDAGAYARFCKEIAHCHHEKWDGTGYPRGINGIEIPLSARAVAIADTYDAITNDRPYRKGRPHQVAVEIIKENSGTQFDPYLVEIFLSIEKEIEEAFKRLK